MRGNFLLERVRHADSLWANFVGGRDQTDQHNAAGGVVSKTVSLSTHDLRFSDYTAVASARPGV